MEKYTMVKSEVQPNGDIFLFYVDENGAAEEAEDVITTTIDQSQLEQLPENYILEEVPVDQYAENNINDNIQAQFQLEVPDAPKERWLEDETKRLLRFYIDNRELFLNGPTKKRDLWAVACKTMLTSKNPNSCEMKLNSLKRKYSQLSANYMKQEIDPRSWPYYDLCHQAFHDDAFVKTVLSEVSQYILPMEQADDMPQIAITVGNKSRPNTNNIEISGLSGIKNVVSKLPDEKLKHMLNLYLQHKKEFSKDFSWQKQFWDKVAVQLGEDGEYWHKRFLNAKQHYIRLLEKRNEGGSEGIKWPYMKIFDKIFEDDLEFQRKFGTITVTTTPAAPNTNNVSIDWNETEKTVLVKYCFDCFDEFQDPTIPKDFLWNEIGRLLDKTAESCKAKYEELKIAHFKTYLEGGVVLRRRKPLAILFDNIIYKETTKILSKSQYSNVEWPTDKIDALVNFLFENMELFKDPITHFVCLAAVAFKLNEKAQVCKEQWRSLTLLYKSILDDKKEDSDLQIDWRYIDLFDRIFDYGMDTKFLEGYEVAKDTNSNKVAAKKVNIKMDDEEALSDEDYDDKTSGKRSRGMGDPNQIKILEYYLKNKDKFSTTLRKKQALWDILSKQIGITAEQCAHRFRNLKQVYTSYILREINKPDMPILWPYYALCKKAFGYRALKNKLRNGKVDSDEAEEWTAKEIKTLINYFGTNFEDLNTGIDDKKKWTSLSQIISKSESACVDKFLDLRKSYRKIKTMKEKNADCKVNWKYYKRLDDIYSGVSQAMEVDSSECVEDNSFLVPLKSRIIKTEIADDDEYQCIIVLPESEDGANISNIENAQIIIKGSSDEIKPKTPTKKWTPKERLAVITEYYNYLKANENKLIDLKEVWQHVAGKFPDRTPYSCRVIYFLLKNRYKKLKIEDPQKTNTPTFRMIKNIFSLKPKFVRPAYSPEEIVLKDKKIYKDVTIPQWKVEKGLKYYLDHVDEFVNPKYDKKYAWIDLANSVNSPVSKMFKKINYLKQSFNSDTGEVNGVKVEYADILKEILEKEFICKIAIGNIVEPMTDDIDTPWSDDEIEQLLLFYLENLEKFKNPKYVASYLWMEASMTLKKPPVACSKKMTEIRSQYSTMVKENPEELIGWKFAEFCQKIYGTGKKNVAPMTENFT